MPLRDLAVNTDELEERWIEEIVEPYVNYDVDKENLILLPKASSLSTRAKVLLYLVALKGWPYLTDNKVSVSAKPAQIGNELGVHGGTLRPALKELKDARLVSMDGQAYEISIPALPNVKAEIEKSASRSQESRGGASRKKSSSKSSGQSSNDKSSGTVKQRRNAEFFDRQVAEGFFNEPKILADVVERFHEYGLTVHKGTVSPLLIKAVRGDQLRRKKSRIDGREMWAYESVK